LAVSARKEGGVLVRERKLGRVYALRFRVYGERQYLTLGFEHEGWDFAKAEVELQNVLADVRRGLWVPPKKKRRARERAESGEDQPFGPFAVELTKSREGQVAEKTTKHEKWALGHLVPFFGDWSLSEIDVEGGR
jgi:integrase